MRRASLPSARRFSKNASTPFCEVKTIHAYCCELVDGASCRRGIVGRAIAIVGARIGSTPWARSVRAKRAPCRRGARDEHAFAEERVRDRTSGALRASATTFPTIATAGAPMPARSASAAIVASVRSRCVGWGACRPGSTATGVFGSRPCASSARAIDSRLLHAHQEDERRCGSASSRPIERRLPAWRDLRVRSRP